MKKFGGAGTLKQPCVTRKCTGDGTGPAQNPAKKHKGSSTPGADHSAAPVDVDAESAGRGTSDYEPFDPAIFGAALSRAAIGYDAASAMFLCALHHGTSLSRCESMVSSAPASLAPPLPPPRYATDRGHKHRSEALALYALEGGIAPMNMMPLPTHIEGEGRMGLGEFVFAEPQDDHGGGRAYGSGFKAPAPYRNEKGCLMVTVHRSRMIGLTLMPPADAEGNVPPLEAPPAGTAAIMNASGESSDSSGGLEISFPKPTEEGHDGGA